MLRKKVKSLLNYFTKTEISLWCISVMLILVSFIIFDRESILTLIASLIGVTSLIFNARVIHLGNSLWSCLACCMELSLLLFLIMEK